MRLTPVLFLALTASVHAAATAPVTGKLRYNRDIRPILSDNCFHCHGPDKSHREADLRLDIRADAITAKAIQPGRPEASSIIERIQTHDEDDIMPPPESKKTLTEAQKQTLIEWVKQGAEYEPHWSYTPLVRPAVPAKQGVHPIDAFIQAELSEKKITPAPLADPRAIIRRLSLDLVGLPPSVTEVEDFLKDSSPKGIQTLVARLVQSPHFGERWAAWWLDVARFSDTVGFHGDQNQRIYPYRDYVINAFNANKQFDQFTLEQLAGDLLPDATTEQRIASGFNRLNMMTREGGAQAKEYLMKYQADRVRTVGGAWLGATLGCCECHDHKFDPFSAHDFYAMSAYFADIKQFGVYSSYRAGESEELKGFSNEHPFPPEILVESPYLEKKQTRIATQMLAIAEAVLKDPAKRQAYEEWRASSMVALHKNQENPWLPLVAEVESKSVEPPPAKGQAKKEKKAKAKDKAPKVELPPAEFRVGNGGQVTFGTLGMQSTSFSFKAKGQRIAAVKIELLPTPEHQDSIVRGGGETSLSFKPTFSLKKAGVKNETNFTLLHADAELKEAVYSSTVERIGTVSGWKTRAADAHKAHSSVWLIEKPPALGEEDVFIVRVPNHTLGSVRIRVASVAPLHPLQDFDANPQAWLAQAGYDSAEYAEWRKLYSDFIQCNGGKTWTQVTVAVNDPMPIRRLPRGNWMDESGEICMPAPPQFLQAESQTGAGSRKSRIDLARWLCSPENPLTARAFMNRLWKQFFGIGLSAATDDLGAQGETPSHPELLDWLACEFRDSGWDIQHMMKLIVTSHTYLQDSKTRPDLKEVDPNNRLLAFQNPRRLDAEFVRDNALAIAGILNLEDIGGPSAKPYQPANYYENLQFPSRDYIADTDGSQWRRGVYMHWQRTFLHPMLANFDAPNRDECTCSRNVSNTPQQALTLLNDPTFVEAARSLASGLPSAVSDESRLDALYLRALARLPKPQERTSLLAFLNTQRETFRSAPEEAAKLLSTGLQPVPAHLDPELAAWTSVCRVVLNLHETITRY
ncbi:MAG: PSD1 and planctomycete cytochrome C domain-containing protein [Verrucomicrobiota bacterium]